MTAKEMFEKLGYEYFKNESRITCEKNTKMIEFVIKNNHSYDAKNILISDDDFEVYDISLEELKAINKQIEELGWDNE